MNRSVPSRIVFWIGIVIFTFIGSAAAFDYAAWIWDPLSILYSGGAFQTDCGITNDDSLQIANTRPAYEQMAAWCDSAGIGVLAVKFPDTATVPYRALAGKNLKIANFNGWPDNGVYSGAKHRYLLPGHGMYQDTLARLGLYPCHEGSGVDYHDAEEDYLEYDPESINELDEHNTFVKPGFTCLEPAWKGWSGLGQPTPYMPMHFRIICDGNINPNYQATDTIVARLDWYFTDSAWPPNTEWWCPGEGALHVKYPTMEIRIDSLFDLTYGNRDTLEFTIDPSPGAARFPRYWMDFGFDTTIVGDDTTIFQTHELDSANYAPMTSHSFSGKHPGRLHITVDGHHGFRMYKVEVWDEGWDRLVEHYTPAWGDTIANHFAPIYNINPANSAGWMTDDEIAPYTMAYPHLMKVLMNHGMPPFLTSSDINDDYYTVLDQAGIGHPIQAIERYIYWGDSTCFPTEPIFGLPIWTDTSSTPGYYLELRPVDPSCHIWASSHLTFSGRRSVQCAIDFEQWGWEPYAYAESNNEASDVLASLLLLMDVPTYEYLKYWKTNGGGERATQWLKARGTTVWSLRQSGRYNSVDIEGAGSPYRAPTRTPSSNEVRLSAWLSVASDADGIMWYGALGEFDTTWYSGLFDWADATGDTLPVNERGDFCDPQFVYRTHTYFAAKDVKERIDQVWPMIEYLDFVRNYASRAFESTYGESDCTWVAKDYLRISPDTSAVDFIKTQYQTSGSSYGYEGAGQTYVQVARFNMPGSTGEDYWLLVINRRALSNEHRIVEIGISNVADSLGAYLVDKVLANETVTTTAYLDANGQSSRTFSIYLEPGDAELIHFYKPDTTALVLDNDTVITAPAYFARNIIVNGVNLTIIPDLDKAAQPVILSGQPDTVYSDVHFFFTEGKGIILAGDSAAGHNGTLSILGSDSVRIIMEAPVDDPDRRWEGIRTAVQGADNLVLENVDIKRARYGLKLQDSNSQATTSGCSFSDCSYGVYSSRPRQVEINHTKFEDNDYGIFASRGTILRLDWCSFNGHREWGIYGADGATLDLVQVTVENGVGKGGIRSVISDIWQKCCKVRENDGVGLEAIGGSVVIADVDTVGARFGANWFVGNEFEELRLDGPLFTWVDQGYNTISDDSGSHAWVAFDGIDMPAAWSYNYWDGLTTDSSIWNHIGSLVEDSLGDPLRPDCTPALASQPNFCYLPPLIPTTPSCIVAGLIEELSPDYISAETAYQDALASTSSSCPKVPTITRLLTVNHLGGTSPSTTLGYLDAVLDTASDSETRHAVKLGIALTLAEGFGNTDSAKTIYQQVIDSAGSDIYRKIDGQAGKLMVEMREEEADTVDGLTYEELSSYLDSLDQILGQRFVWTQYEITDSVVMYAPTRVDSVINVRGNGVLTILPHPGYKDPVIEFVNKGAINVYGTDTTKAKGKLYVCGEPDSRVTLHWGDSTGTKNIYSNRGFVKMKYADFYGEGFVNQSWDLAYLGRAIFQADSCTFAWFDEGVSVRGTDTTSYLRACTLSHMGGSYNYYGVGAGLIIIHADKFTVEDCVFEGNDGTGIFHAYSDDVLIKNCVVRNGVRYGVFGSSSGGGSGRLECCTVESNGDTLAELYTLGVIYDLVGAHNSFADSSGPLIKSPEPSYVDLENGENYFEVWDDGRYLQSGDTNDTWDITWNTWNPAMPDDSNFYDYLWPATPAKWTVDSSLTEFLTCGESATSSIGGGSWLVLNDDPESGTMSTGGDEPSKNRSLSLKKPSQTTKGGVTSKAKQYAPDYSMKSSGTAYATRKQAKVEKLAQHNRELTAWRAVRGVSKGGTAARAAMQFLTEHQGSEFTPAALGIIAGSARGSSAILASSYLRKFADQSRDRSLRVLAQRLSYQALANEGKPAEALSGLEDMMTDAKTPRDSVLALLDAMQVYLDFQHTGVLQAKHPQVIVTDPYDLVRKTLALAMRLDDPELGAPDHGPAIPTRYALYQNYPNPFNPSTEIRFDLPEAIRVELKIFNILGQEVATLIDDVRSAGAYQILWDGKNAGGLSVASGVYVYQIKTGNFQDAKKMVLIR